MAKRLIFQQSPESIANPRPWPVSVGVDGRDPLGRPDASQVLGFQRDGQQTIAVSLAQAFLVPEDVIGLQPVYLGTDGHIFGIELVIESAAVREVEEGRERYVGK